MQYPAEYKCKQTNERNVTQIFQDLCQSVIVQQVKKFRKMC